MVVLITELKGNDIKKLLNAIRVTKRYHNRNNSGGNFAIMIRLQNGKNYDLEGVHDTKDVVRRLRLAPMYGNDIHDINKLVITDENYSSINFAILGKQLQGLLGVAQAPIKRAVSDRNKGATVTIINGISFVDYTTNSHRPTDFEEVRVRAKQIVKDRSEKLKNSGFKRVELDSIGGYSHRRISSGRFIPLTTMHNLRIMKR